jgi:hypothetical protein
MYIRRKGDVRILALRRRHRPILAVRKQDAPSAHFLEVDMIKALGVALGNATL